MAKTLGVRLREKGSYILIVELRDEILVVLSRRVVGLKPGYYAYVGSAGGPGGLRARLSRHCAKEKKVFWHIDRLTTSPRATVLFAYYCVGVWGRAIEATLAKCLERELAPIPRFGSTDDREVITHLFYTADVEKVKKVSLECLERICQSGIGVYRCR
ncbi:MAG TPA: GIY-YIG nuclease family protein [Pyrodictiaceae archaeon]|nr:GIY-YIG nuclease family protein [Pyrodictiaceae archaeon]